MTDAFKTGHSYTRAQIKAALGGSVQSVLPVVNGVVVAACVRPDADPDAPGVLLIGAGHGIEAAADLLVAQTTPVPVFLKRASTAWEYVGNYVVASASDEYRDVELYERISGRNDLTRVLRMTKASA